jgi:two-component system, chemotaxis family, sensor kinase CheA
MSSSSSIASMDNARYADLFRIEAREHLAELDAALLALEQGSAEGHGDAQGDATSSLHRDEQIATLFRGTHTIKGMAAAMGYRAVESVSHAMESLLDRARGGGVSLTADVLALLLDATDLLATAVSDTTQGVDDPDRASVRNLLRRLDGVTNAGAKPRSDDVFGSVVAIDTGVLLGSAGFEDVVGAGAQEANQSARTASSASAIRRVEIRLSADCPLKGVRALLVYGALERLGALRDVQPAQTRWHEDAFDGVFAASIETGASDADIESAARSAGDVARVDVRAMEQRAPETSSRESVRHVRIDLRRLDSLLDLVGELVITRDRLLRVAEAAAENGADRAIVRAANDTARLVSALQEEVLQARMVPVAQVFDRFPRLVRDIARDLGKDVQFVTEGQEIEMDRALLDAVGDPIMHLLRNALDHGLEDPETRRAAGKPPTGRLVLRAARDRASVVIQVEDNGRGIDRGAVMRRALEKGLLKDIDELDAHLDDDRLLQTLAHSGLSTARSVTAISGRGVGVDVVATRVRALGGLLSLETIDGVGTVFTMRLPTTLAIMRALLVRVADDIYAIPGAHIVEALEYDPAMRTHRNGEERALIRGQAMPVLRLRDRFGYPPGETEGFVAVVEASGRRCALFVDGLVAQQDVVVKPFDAVRGGAPWFSGATVLGDGTPSLIVDLGSLI